jgi:isopenicillin-N epimerase
MLEDSMSINRREFAATVGASLLAGRSATGFAVTASGAVSVPDYADWAKVRSEFDLAPGFLHLAQFYLVSHPRPVRAAIERYRRIIDANPVSTVEHGMGFDTMLGLQTHEEPFAPRIQQVVADYLGGQPQEVALTDSTTQGLALIYNGLTLKPADEILTTTHDHYSHHESIRLAAERSGARVRRVALYDEAATASMEQMIDRLRRAIGPNTRVVGLTWVHSSTGVKIPLRALVEVVADFNRNRGPEERLLLVLDAVHGFGNQDESLAAVGVDFVAAGTHKWIFAPRGTGIIWAPAKNWPLLRPTIPTFYSGDLFEAWETGQPPKATANASWISPGGFKAFEHQWAMIEAFEFHRSASPYRLSYARLAPSLVNDEHEVEEALRAVRSIAA